MAILALAVGALAGCAGMTPTGPTEAVVLPITSFEAVKGKWAGVLERTTPSRRREDFVELTVNPDGTYRFTSARTIGVLQGSGQLALKDGRLSSATQRGSATYRLLDRDGTPVLKVDAVTADGQHFSADLTR